MASVGHLHGTFPVIDERQDLSAMKKRKKKKSMASGSSNICAYGR